MDEKRRKAELPSPPRTSLALAAGAAGLAAAILPGQAPGLNLSLCAVAVGLALGSSRPGGSRPGSPVLPVFALLLATTPILRAAGWVIALNMLAAAALACWAVAGAISWTGLVHGLAAPVARLPMVPAIVAGSMRSGRRPMEPSRVPSVLRAMFLASGLLFIFGMLFASADAAFAHLAARAFPEWELDDWTALRIMVFAAVFSGTVALILAAPRYGMPLLNRLVDRVFTTVAPVHEGERRLAFTLTPVEWVPALALLVTLFAVFVGVQLTVLFGGHDHVLSAAGLTYAEYARQGFGQLLAASGLTLALLAGASLAFNRPTPRDRALFRALFGALCGLTLAVLGSALHRLSLYEAAFGFTRLRITAHAAIYWLACVFALVAVLGAMSKMKWLPMSVVSLSAAGLICFAVWNPDRQIAERNVHRFRETGKLDTAYLSTLSPDAVPALAPLRPEERKPIVRPILDRLDAGEPWTSWNLGRAEARRAAGSR